MKINFTQYPTISRVTIDNCAGEVAVTQNDALSPHVRSGPSIHESAVGAHHFGIVILTCVTTGIYGVTMGTDEWWKIVLGDVPNMSVLGLIFNNIWLPGSGWNNALIQNLFLLP